MYNLYELGARRKGIALQTFSTLKHPNYECTMSYYIRYSMFGGIIGQQRKESRIPKKHQKYKPEIWTSIFDFKENVPPE